MKIDPHDCICARWSSTRAGRRRSIGVNHALLLPFWAMVIGGLLSAEIPHSFAQSALSTSQTQPTAAVMTDPARRLLARVIEQIALGPAFDAKFRQRVWVGGREVIGVGTYEQAGDGSGWFNMQVAMHDGDGKHTLQQISDGRLAWTREQIGDIVRLQRVDVGRLDQWIHGTGNHEITAPVHREETPQPPQLGSHLPPSVRVGGWTEMLESIAADHDLEIVSGRLEDRDVWIVRGSLRANVRETRLAEFGTTAWPELCPTHVVVAIAKTPSQETGFGQGLPLRIEFWTDPIDVATKPGAANSDSPPMPSGRSNEPVDNPLAADSHVAGTSQDSSAETGVPAKRTGRLISLIELYSIRPISSPPIGRFRFENQDMEVNFTNDTDRYLSRYGIHITERQSRMLRR
ncbi:hypothetical protein [Aporhodopirellula aestuarii]|uniref:Secreted protein n=1 Tax=Aporhodopirellula aestuarii TaxID=2950107 RepID=A0ABT0U126_9BACT|nr:hypothetical protein [Aporhodopirellula aestuarii]MCM2370547.1 hypothetical protein [Aporhodopirellula aestuarii]